MMIDNITYGLTQTLPGGPIIRPDPNWPPSFDDLGDIDDIAEPPSRALSIARAIATIGLIGVVGYLFLAL